MAEVFNHQRTFHGDTYVDIHLGDGVTVAFETNKAEVPPLPLAIFHVEDLDLTHEAVIAAGGGVRVESFNFPGGRRFQLREPGGNKLSVWMPVEA